MVAYNKLQSLLAGPLATSPKKIALRCGGQALSYEELERGIRQLAAALQVRGVKRGDRVAWFLPNGVEAVLTTLACSKIGAVSLPLNYRYPAPEARYVLETTAARMLIFHADRREVVEKVRNQIEPLDTVIVGDPSKDSSHLLFASLLGGESLAENVMVEADDAALILFTSGSTGRPKGVIHSHAGCYAAIDISRCVFDFTEDDVVLVGKPVSHAGGLQTQMLPALLAGGEVVLAMKPPPAVAASLIAQHQVTEYGLLASDLVDFVEYLEEHSTALPSLRNSIGSGDVVPHDLHRRFRELFGWEVMEGCGMTEVGCYYAVNPRYGKRKWGSLGLPAPDIQLRVVNSEGADAAVCEVGEILVRSPSATIGYWHDEPATKELFHDGWLHTGDLGYFDEDAYLWFVGRKKLMIVRRGSNIAPAEVEDVLDEHPKVHASVVVGVPDVHDGHVPVACIAPVRDTEPPTEDELRSFVASRLAAYKNPTRYFFVVELPRNSAGKFDRHRLEEMIEGQKGSDRQ
jgi:fatty-acyl-CoA synthase